MPRSARALDRDGTTQGFVFAYRMYKNTHTHMSVVLGLALPGVLLAWAVLVRAWYAWAVLGTYVLATFASRTVKRLGRAGYVPCGGTVVVGGGWSWVLRGDRLWPPNRMTCRSGRVDGTSDWWYAGTTIGDVQRTLAREGRTLAGHPSILSATLGGWIASQSHGTGGSLWTPTIGALEVEHEGTRHVLPSKSQFTDGMLILAVRLHTVPDVVCERRAVEIAAPRDASEALRTPTHLRAVFVDRYRALAFLWVPSESDETDPETFPPPWLAMLLPAWTRRRLAYPPRRVRLSDANRFAPVDPPLLLATPLIATRINFELFVARPTTGDLLWTLCREFRSLFASGAVRGRLEIRFGASKQFLDFDLARRRRGYAAVLECLHRVYGRDVQYKLHPGKAQRVFALTTAPSAPEEEEERASRAHTRKRDARAP